METLERIGQGQCAEVYKVKWRGTYAVSKVLKRAENYKAGWTLATARADLVHEISVLSHLRHPNLGTKPYQKEIPRQKDMCIHTHKISTSINTIVLHYMCKCMSCCVMGRAASGGALAPEPPHSNQPESIWISCPHKTWHTLFSTQQKTWHTFFEKNLAGVHYRLQQTKEC